MSQGIDCFLPRKNSTAIVNVQNNLQVKDVYDRTTVNKSMAEQQDKLGKYKQTNKKCYLNLPPWVY